MGTICTQAARQLREVDSYRKDELFKEIKDLSKKHKLPTNEIIKGLQLLEDERKNKLYIDSGDNFDECMCGISQSIESISRALEDKNDQTKWE